MAADRTAPAATAAFRLTVDGGDGRSQAFVLKYYRRDAGDPRDRLSTEVSLGHGVGPAALTASMRSLLRGLRVSHRRDTAVRDGHGRRSISLSRSGCCFRCRRFPRHGLPVASEATFVLAPLVSTCSCDWRACRRAAALTRISIALRGT
jgi:hypothetical protein